VYFQPVEADQPVRLVGWQAVTAAPGEAVQATVRADPRLWRRWNSPERSWDVLADGGELLVARGLGDIRARLHLPAGR
jgi:beta-glucosidase